MWLLVNYYLGLMLMGLSTLSLVMGFWERCLVWFGLFGFEFFLSAVFIF